MLKVPKFLYYVIAACIFAVVITFCVMAIIEKDTTALVNNVVLAISAIIGLVIKRDDNDSGNEGASKPGASGDTSSSEENNDQESK